MRGVLEVDTTTTLLAQMQALAIQNVATQKKLGILPNSSPALVLDVTYVKEVTLIESARWNHHLKSKLITRIPRRHNFNSNHYTLRYKDHNNSRHYCGNQGPPRNSYNQPAYEKKLNLEDMFQQFMQTHSNFVDRTEARFKQYDA